MKVLYGILCVILLSFFNQCTTPHKTLEQNNLNTHDEASKVKPDAGDAFFKELFKANPGRFDSVIAHKNAWNVQVIYTKIDRNVNNQPSLTSYTFNKQPTYFYPASTVKLPIVLTALQKVKELNLKGIDKYTTMLTEAGYSGQTPVYNDPNTADGRPSIAQYIKKIFLVSDNDASNRLYEFAGQEYINTALHKKGFKEVQVRHRVGIALSEDENRHTNPVNFYDSAGKLLYSQPLQFNTKQYETRHEQLGRGYYANGALINTAMDFSRKNRVSLRSLHDILIGLVFPVKVKHSRRFNITEDDRNFVLRYMSQFPGESVFPSYDTSQYPDAYAKFILYGSRKEALPKQIRIFNKVGDAYGQLVDVAYITDFENKIEFFVSAAITCNTDGILNDDKYDYETIGFPFLKDLGEALYRYELNRPKKYAPDLSAFKFTYDK